MPNVYLDFETRGSLDLKKSGASKYAEHPDTDVLCVAYMPSANVSQILLIEGAKPLWFRLTGSPALDLWFLAKREDYIFVAHNAFFERTIWTNIMVKRYGYPEIPIHRWKCTMAKGWAHGLPGKLEEVAKELQLVNQKDMAGNRAMKALSKPKTKKQQEKTGSMFWTPQEKPEQFKLMYDYCIQDVACTRELDQRIRDLSPEEQQVWEADQRMNTDGIVLDMSIVNTVRKWIDVENAEIFAEFKHITGVDRPTLRDDFQAWLVEQGYPIDNTQKDTIKKLLARVKKPHVKAALHLFQAGTKSSIAKYEKAFELATEDGLLREILAYHAAHTGRYGGRGVQVQNLTRPDGFDIEAAIQTMIYGYDFFKWSFEG